MAKQAKRSTKLGKLVKRSTELEKLVKKCQQNCSSSSNRPTKYSFSKADSINLAQIFVCRVWRSHVPALAHQCGGHLA